MKRMGKGIGGQRENDGNTLRVLEHPDIAVVQRMGHYMRYSKSLRTKRILKYDRGQEFEISPLKIEVTEHQAEM